MIKKIALSIAVAILAGLIATAVYQFGYKKTAAMKTGTEEGPVKESQAFSLTGDVKIKKPDESEWADAALDMTVADGYTVSTGDTSLTEVKFGRNLNNYIAAGNNTEVKFTDIEKPGDKYIELTKGRVLVVINELDPGSKFEVRTPTSVCGAAGTGFEVVSQPGVDIIKVYDGSVYVKNVDALPFAKGAMVGQGYMTRIEAGKKPQRPVAIGPSDIDYWNGWKAGLESRLFRPIYVFQDEGSIENHFTPSGWIGDYDAIRRAVSEDVKYSGKNSIRFRYTGKPTQGAGWSGVYWQNPANNWGDLDGGYNLRGAKKLTFWAKGEKGGETIMRFGIGGISREYPDTCKVEIGPVSLESEWKQYEVDLTDRDLSYISGGFFWMTDKSSNPEGAIFYIDEVKYE